jgi:dCMP deaminase
MSGKREDYYSKDMAFMGMAALVSARSKDPRNQIGCVIVNTKGHIASCGHNGMPVLHNGKDNDEVFPWERKCETGGLGKEDFVVHSERNGIDNAARRSDLVGASMYLYSQKGFLPCAEKGCAHAIVSAQIAEVIVPVIGWGDRSEKKWGGEASEMILREGGVVVRSIFAETLWSAEYCTEMMKTRPNTVSSDFRRLAKDFEARADALEEMENRCRQDSSTT